MNELISQASIRELQQYIFQICRGIRSAKKRGSIQQEYEEHIEDHVYCLLLQGVSEQQAVKRALESLGDPESLCHALCAVHNRIPPDLGKNLLRLAVRAFVAWIVGGVLWGAGLLESLPVVYAIPVLITFGLSPFRYVRSLALRVKHVIRLNRVCKRKGFTKTRQASPILSVFFPTRCPEWLIETPKKTYCIHFLAVHNRHAHLTLLDSFAYTLTTIHGQGARFIDRAPRRFNSLKSADQTYENQSFHTLHFPIQVEKNASRIERILLLNPVPSEIRHLKGSTFEYAGNGDRVYDFTLYDAASFSDFLKQVA